MKIKLIDKGTALTKNIMMSDLKQNYAMASTFIGIGCDVRDGLC